MFSYCTDYTATMPDVTIHVNCDTILKIDLNAFALDINDEFIFVIKNYSYIDSSYVFIHRARLSDMDANGRIFIKIPSSTSKHLKPGAFYNFAVMKNAFDRREPTEYKRLSDNGKIILDYGAQDFLNPSADITYVESDIINVRFEQLEEDAPIESNIFMNEIIDISLETVDD